MYPQAKKSKIDDVEEADVDDDEELFDDLAETATSISEEITNGDKDSLSVNSEYFEGDSLSLNSTNLDSDLISLKLENLDGDTFFEKLDNNEDEDASGTWTLRGSIKKRKVSAKKMKEIMSFLKKSRAEKNKMKVCECFF